MAESHLVFHITFLGSVSGVLCNFFSDMVIETLSALLALCDGGHYAHVTAL